MAGKGKPKTGGRAKGVPNKVNSDLKGMILTALSEVGGEKYLKAQAAENPLPFLAWWARCCPRKCILI